MDREFRIEGARYLPEPGEIIMRVRRGNGLALCIVAAQHDGSEESLRDVNSALRTWASRLYSSMSPAKSNTYYRTKEGEVGVVSPDGTCIAPLDSEEGRYILSDTEARPTIANC